MTAAAMLMTRKLELACLTRMAYAYASNEEMRLQEDGGTIDCFDCCQARVIVRNIQGVSIYVLKATKCNSDSRTSK